MNELDAARQVQYWPVIMGWILVVCMYLFRWRRQALIASLGMALVTAMVLGVGRVGTG